MQIKRTGYHLSDRTYDLLVCLLIILFSLILWWPSRYFPYFWNSAATTSLAPLWKLFGPSLLVSHIFMLPFLPIFLISTYHLAKKYLTRYYAILATSLVAFSPVVLAEYLNIDVSLPAAALATLGACLIVSKKPIIGTIILAVWISVFLFTANSLPKIPSEFVTRYYLYFLPIFAILISMLIQKLTSVIYIPGSILLIVVLSLPLTQMLLWRSSTDTTSQYEFNPPRDLAIIDKLRIFRELSLTIESIAPQAEIYGGFPESQMLTQPYQGYVTRSLNFNSCENYSYNPEVLQLIVIHPYAPSQIPCRQLLDTQKLTRLQHFEKNGKWIELYQVEASASATTSDPATP